jgi:hypothetical protein
MHAVALAERFPGGRGAGQWPKWAGIPGRGLGIGLSADMQFKLLIYNRKLSLNEHSALRRLWYSTLIIW